MKRPILRRILLLPISLVLTIVPPNSTVFATYPGANGLITAAQVVPANDTNCPTELSYAGQVTFEDDFSNPQKLILTDQPSYSIESKLSWSPDGDQFAFKTGEDTVYGVANADGSSIEGIGGGYGFESAQSIDTVSWLPDGITLAMGNYWGLWTSKLGTFNNTFIKDGGNGTFNDLRYGFNDIVWSPDGTHFAYNKNWLYGGHEPVRIGVGDADGMNQHIFSETNRDPDWSPDSKRIVFASNRSGLSTNPSQIYTMNYDGTGLIQLTNDINYRYQYPIWSPDGTKILVAREEATTGYSQPMILMTLDSQTGTVIDTYIPPCEKTYFNSLSWQALGPSKVYRMANWKTKERLFTVNKGEALFTPDDNNGWILEGAAFTVQDETNPGVTPIYRLANWKTKERLFTTSAYERDYAVAHHEGWVSEGVAFYATPSPGTSLSPVYRLANWKTHERLFTTDSHERDYAITHYEGWVSEGVAFYVPES